MDKIKILFMGTPDFAVSVLRAIYETGLYDISVITQPDKPKGRGFAVLPTEVKEYAESVGLGVYQPQTLKCDEASEYLDRTAPDMIVVAAYGKILPAKYIDYPKYGCINVHGSLLPEYRGAAPIQRVILDGKETTGITIMKMDIGLDTGDMLMKLPVRITDEDDFGTLFDKMCEAGAEGIVSAIPKIVSGEIIPEKQDDTLACYAAKIEKEDCRINFSDPADRIYNQIRGLSPVPLANFVRTGGIQIKVVSAIRGADRKDVPAGTAYKHERGIEIVCGDGKSLILTEIVPAGKKRMKSVDYLRGNPIENGGILVQ